MKKLIFVLMAALMTIGSAAAAEQTEDDLLESMISAMALRDKVAQMMLPSFRLWKEVPEKDQSGSFGKMKTRNVLLSKRFRVFDCYSNPMVATGFSGMPGTSR